MRARTRLRASLTQCTGQWYACQGKKPRPLSYQTFAHSLKEERKLQKVTLWTSLIAIYLYSIPQFLLLPVLLFVLDSTGKRLFLVLGRPLSSFDNTIDAIGPDLRFNLGMVVKETRGNRLLMLKFKYREFQREEREGGEGQKSLPRFTVNAKLSQNSVS